MYRNYRINDWFINFVNIKFNIYLCILTATVITVYKYDKQKTIIYYSDLSKMEESKKLDILLLHGRIKSCTENKSSVVTYLSSAYFIPIYVCFIIAKNCGFVMGFEILAIYVQLKHSFFVNIFNVNT